MNITRNSKSYDSADVKVLINGVEIEVSSISYGNEQEHQLNYSLSSNPTSWSRGKITPHCTMGIYMHDIAPLEQLAKGGLLNIPPFDVIVTYTNEYNIIIMDHLVVKFQKEGREVTGEMGLKMEYEMFALQVNLNVN